jgi:protocatechuate 4,5-dioxygenase alpha subunit
MPISGRTDPNDIPGTLVFDGRRSRQGFPLNSMCAALNNDIGRKAFQDDPEEFMERFRLSAEQKEAVRARDWLRMIDLGGNIYFIAKIGISSGMSIPAILSDMLGCTPEEFAAMMREGGRKPNG